MGKESELLNVLADYAPSLHWADQLRQAVYNDPNTNPRARAAVDQACIELVVLLVAGVLPEESHDGEDGKLIRSLPNYNRVIDSVSSSVSSPGNPGLLGYLVGLAAAYTYSSWGTLPWQKVSQIVLEQEAVLR